MFVRRTLLLFAVAPALLGLGLLAASPARAECGWETPCDIAPDGAAKLMLKRVAAAIKANEAAALVKFQRGEGGFRGVDTYVFCVGPDGVMSAHPSPLLQGQDVRDLHDQTGNYFIATMLKNAKTGEVSEIHYLFPRPGSAVAQPKTTFYTRAGDQVCGVGVYDGADAPDAPQKADHPALPQLRQRLDAEIPASLRPDWKAFIEAEDEERNAQAAAFAKVRESLRAADAVMASTIHP